MAGNKQGGLQAAATNKRIYGDSFYADIGRIGGKSSGHTLHDVLIGAAPKGFAANQERAKSAGRKGGLISKRGPWTEAQKKEAARIRAHKDFQDGFNENPTRKERVMSKLK